MNLLFLEGDMSRRGGTERMTALLANKLCETDNVWVISTKLKENTVFFDLDSRVQHNVLSVINSKCGIFTHIVEIREFIRRYEINWVINVDIGMSIFGIPASWGTKAKVVTWEHANYYNSWNSKIFPYFRRFAAKCSDAVVVLTERDKDNYQSNIKTKKPIHTIPNPVKYHDFSYDLNSKIILSAGLLLPIKGYDLAIQVAAKVMPNHPEWSWIICGDGPERDKLEKLILEYGLEDQMFLSGTISDMSKKYQEASFFVMTSKMEGLPMVLLEAKSWGLPIVSYDIMTGPSDIVSDGINGFLVEPEDIVGMSEKIEKLIVSDEIRKQFSEQSQIDMEKFNFERIIRKWKQILM